MSSPYDSFAWFYDRYWAEPFQEWQRPALEKLAFAHLPERARVLDLCCGTGQLSQRLTTRGYEVVGIDASEQMLRLARRNAPAAVFQQADAAEFQLDRPVDAALCTFDSLNHVIELEHVVQALRNTYAALKPAGRFVFDVNTSRAYGEHWDRAACEVAPDHAFILRGGFNRQSRIGTTDITMFQLVHKWQRSDVQVRQRPWDEHEIEQMLSQAGFTEFAFYRPLEDLGIKGHYGEGRVYVAAVKGAM